MGLKTDIHIEYVNFYKKIESRSGSDHFEGGVRYIYPYLTIRMQI